MSYTYGGKEGSLPNKTKQNKTKQKRTKKKEQKKRTKKRRWDVVGGWKEGEIMSGADENLEPWIFAGVNVIAGVGWLIIFRGGR